MVRRRYLQSCQEYWVYLWTLPLCMFRSLVFLALKSQSWHWVVGSIGVVVGSLSVHGLCLCSLVAISTWYAAVEVSIRLGFVYLLTYPSRMIRRLFCKTVFWYCVVLVRGTMMLLLYLLRWMLVVMGWFGSFRIRWTMLTHCSFKKSSMGLMLCTRRIID
jgi:hypothetical protein